MTSDPFPSPEAAKAAEGALEAPHAGRTDLQITTAALHAAVKAQPVVALPPCPTCRSVGDKRVVAGQDTDDPCPYCKGSGVDRLIPESEIREWIKTLPLGNHIDHEDGSSSYAPLGASGAMDRLRSWLDKREARQ